MPVMYSFMFWFSVRLGSIIVAVFTLCQSLGALIAASIGMENQKAFSQEFDNLLTQNEFGYMANVIVSIKDNPKDFLTGLIVVLTLHTISCLLLIAGAFMCKLIFVYPFIGLELGRLLFMSFLFITAMILFKENIPDLGLLIAACCIGGFTLLFFFYLWFCTISLCQIVKELEGMENKHITSKDIQSHNDNQYYSSSYISNVYTGLTKPV